MAEKSANVNSFRAKSVSRRDFIMRTSAGAAAVTASSVFVAPAAARVLGANCRLNVGVIGAGLRGQSHITTLARMAAAGENVAVVAVSDVYSVHRQRAADKIAQANDGKLPQQSVEYRDILANPAVDAVVIATPNHWHARMAADALRAGKHVYCETPAFHGLNESAELLAAWRETGLVFQSGVQRTSDGRWLAARDYIAAGGIGKVVQAQTAHYCNSAAGQWRTIGLSREMTPATIDWARFLGTEAGLAPEMPFDRARFAQWRCYWPFAAGLFSELFVPRITRMMLALGVRAPRRVTAGGGIFLEQDGRDVPDTGTLIADFDEGLQLLVTAALCNDHETEHCIRGYLGTIVFNMAREGFDVLPQRPRATRQAGRKKEHVSAFVPQSEDIAHMQNFVDAVRQGNPRQVNNPPDLAAAATMTAMLGALAYRTGRTLELQGDQIVDSGVQYAAMWEELSAKQAAAQNAGAGPQLPEYQKLAGPWRQGKA